ISTSNEELDKPSEYFLDQNYPNPFNPSTQIRFGLANSETVTVEVFNVTGQRVKRINMGHLTSGTHELRLDMSNLAGGLYIYRVSTPNFRASKSLILFK